MYLLPTINDSRILTNGEYIEAIDYCKKNCDKKKCKAFYDSLSQQNTEQFILCPYGLVAYIHPTLTGKIIFTGMRNLDLCNKSKAKALNTPSDCSYNPWLNSERLIKLINASIQLTNKELQLNDKRATIDSISHEVKKINAQIKERSDALLQTYSSTSIPSTEILNDILDEIRTIYVGSSMIVSRFSLYDYEKNPRILEKGATFNCNIYKKFDKMRMLFKNYMKKHVAIVLQGTSYSCISAHPSFDMIPLLIIDNAVKYAYPSSTVTISFTESKNTLIVTIESYSPFCTSDEIIHIFDKGFRGHNAQRTSDGSGVGLYFVKLLCDLHNIQIHASSDKNKITNINEINYSNFIITLLFNNTFSE